MWAASPPAFACAIDAQLSTAAVAPFQPLEPRLTGTTVCGRLSVGRRRTARRPGARTTPGTPVKPATSWRGLVPVGCGQPGWRAVDDHGREDVRRLERRLQLQHLGRLRLGGQPGLGVVLLRAGQLAGQRARERGDDQPEHEDRPLGTAAPRQAQQGAGLAHLHSSRSLKWFAVRLSPRASRVLEDRQVISRAKETPSICGARDCAVSGVCWQPRAGGPVAACTPRCAMRPRGAPRCPPQRRRSD